MAVLESMHTLLLLRFARHLQSIRVLKREGVAEPGAVLELLDASLP